MVFVKIKQGISFRINFLSILIMLLLPFTKIIYREYLIQCLIDKQDRYILDFMKEQQPNDNTTKDEIVMCYDHAYSVVKAFIYTNMMTQLSKQDRLRVNIFIP